MTRNLMTVSPGAPPAGLVVRLGRSVRTSRPRLEAWLGAVHSGDRADPVAVQSDLFEAAVR
ncbi:MAG: hypothetical protein ACT4P5_01805 [Armatimonadota bacterium]